MTITGGRALSLGFDLRDEHRMLYQEARAFARDRLAPGAAARDEHEAFPSEHLGALAELGLLAMKVREEDGGSGTDNVGTSSR